MSGATAVRAATVRAATVRAVARPAVMSALGIAGAAVGVRLAAGTRGWLGPVRVQAHAAFGVTSNGTGTRLEVPPLGHATARTHRGPLRLSLLATGIDPDRAQGLLRMPGDAADTDAVATQLDAVLHQAGTDGSRLGRALAVRTVLAALGGAAAFGALAARGPREVGVALAAGAATLGAGAVSAAATLDREAWREPELTGLLRKAPLILGDLRTAPARIGTYRDQLADLLRTATAAYLRVAQLPDAPPADVITLVHVSDIHLSPVAHALAGALVEQYRADAVIDTGDLVDWGTPAENAFTARAAAFDVPYVFVKGNHDSAGIAAAMARQPNAVVLDVDDPPREVAGVRFVGMADPRFTPDKTTGDDDAPHRVDERAAHWARLLAALPAGTVDVALAHDPNAARALSGLAPLMLAGHTHRRSVRRYGDVLVLVQGTSGGSGLRAVQADPPPPVSLSVVFLERDTRALWGVDEVTLGGLGEVSLQIVRRRAAELNGAAQSRGTSPAQDIPTGTPSGT